MGQLFQKGGLTMPNSQLQTAGGPSFVGSPSQVLSKANAGLPSADSMMGPDVLNPNQQAPKLPFIGQPSFQQAATTGAQPGGTNAMSPGLNKAGKLVTLLSSGLQGALAGRAAQEQAAVQSGGRRAGGVGMAMEAGYNLPAQRQATQQGLAQQRAQTALTESQSEMVPTEYGNLPAALARYILPAQIRGEATEGAAQTRAGATLGAAGIGAKARTGAAEIGAEARVKSAQLGLGPMANVPQDLQDQFGLPAQLPIKMLNQAESAQNRPLTVVQGEAGPSVVNKAAAAQGKPGATKTLGLGAPRMGSVVQVGDPNNPGNTTFSTAGNAVRQNLAGTQSASVQVPKAAAKAEVPTKIGDQKVAFTTMIQHAELLRDAARALSNGDVQTLAGLKNAFKNEFGYSGPITAQAIADAYGGEVTNVISKGHITDAEVAKTGRALNPSKQNFETVNRVLTAYQALAQSKMNMLNQQKQSAINQSQTKKAGAPAENDPLGIR